MTGTLARRRTKIPSRVKRFSKRRAVLLVIVTGPHSRTAESGSGLVRSYDSSMLCKLDGGVLHRPLLAAM